MMDRTLCATDYLFTRLYYGLPLRSESRKNNEEQRSWPPFASVACHTGQNTAAFCGLYGEALRPGGCRAGRGRKDEGRKDERNNERSSKHNTIVHTTPRDSRGESGDGDTAHITRQSSGIAAGSTR